MNANSVKKTFRKQSFYHPREGFDYEKFFYSIYGFALPVIEGNYLLFSTLFLKEDEQGKPYGEYSIGKKHLKIPGMTNIYRYLSNYKIDLTDSKNHLFSIFKAYHSFSNLNVDLNEGPLKSVSIKKEYLVEQSQMINYSVQDPNTFQLVEDEYAHKLLSSEFVLSEDVKFLPLPIIYVGNLVGMIYFLIPEGSLRFNFEDHSNQKPEDQSLKNAYRSWIIAATREYERIRLESKFDTYAPKPQDPLEDYWEVFNDLKNSKYPDSKKEINYPFLYDFGAWKPVITENEFLKDLGYDDYYESLAPVLAEESKRLYRGRLDRIRAAIISIIIDSFAHNIGAHSLVALKWWFESRYRIAAGKFRVNKRVTSYLEIKRISDRIHKKLEATLKFHSFMDDLDHSIDTERLSLLNIIRFMNEDTQKNLLAYRDSSTLELISEFPIPVAQSIFQFFQYLRDKSAFWSGVARDTVFSGLIKSWPQLIREFLNNTLFLGTIAHSEGINKIFVHLELLDEEGKINISGEYAQINLSLIEREQAQVAGVDLPPPPKDKQGYSEYAFLRKGEDFLEVQEELLKLEDVFLPNGIIGQHALYTIIENTLRNIKHYRDHFDKLKKEGIRLFISIQSAPFWKRKQKGKDFEHTDHSPLFKVGTWLHHPQKLLTKEGAKVNEEKEPFLKDEGAIIANIAQQLRQRVVNEKGNAILGGSSQDKVCSAMLMNNQFLSIDQVNLDIVKRHYFPYVYTASEFFGPVSKRIRGVTVENHYLHKIYNHEIADVSAEERKRKYKVAVEKYIQRVKERQIAGEEHRGTIKKYFHLWKGKKCTLVKKEFERRNENLPRFRIVAVDEFLKDGVVIPFRVEGSLEDRRETAEYHLRQQGIVRLVKANEHIKLQKDPNLQYDATIQKWLGEWIGFGKKRILLTLRKPAGNRFLPFSAVELINLQDQNQWQLTYYNELDLLRNGDLKQELERDSKQREPAIPFLNIAHGQHDNDPSKCVNIRSHCSFAKDLYEGFGVNQLSRAKFTFKEKPAKLLETAMTSITVFDERIHERLPNARPKIPATKALWNL